MARRRNEVPADTQPGDLSDSELKFIDEYLVDRDAHAAALRAGVARINVKKRVQQWMSDTRILKAIQLKTDNTDLDKMISPQRIMAGFIDVAFDRNAPSASRNTALRELAQLKKMYGDDDKDRAPSGVIMVPVAGTLQDWKEMAMASQQKLKDDVRD